MAKKKESLTVDERIEKALVPKEEQPYEIPSNWVWTRLGEVSDVITGNTPSKNNYEYWENKDIYFVKPSDLAIERDLYLSEEKIDKRAKRKLRLIPKYSTLLCCIGSLGKASYSMVEVATNQQINSLVPKEIIFPLYIYYFSQTLYMKRQMLEMSSATTVTILNKSSTEKLFVPLPPLEEQKRIVKKVESMLDKIKEAKEIINDVREKALLRKESFLNKAFTGELTSKWRSENETTSATKLLEKINDEKLKKWEEECKVAESEGKKKPKKPALKTVAEMIVPKEEEPYEIPSNWVWTRLGEVSVLNPQKDVLNFEEEDQLSFVPMKAVSEITKKIENIEVEKYSKLKKGYTQFRNEDIIFAKITPCMENGKLAIAKGLKHNIGYGSTEFHVIRSSDSIKNTYIYYFISQQNFRDEARYNMTGSVGFLRVPADFMKIYAIPLPPLEEQKEIVRILDDVLEKEREIEELCNMEENLELLEKSILDKAFRGELGTNSTDDESAIELLRKMYSND